MIRSSAPQSPTNLLDAVCSSLHGIPASDARIVCDKLLTAIQAELLAGRTVQLPFGRLELRARRSRSYRNPQTKQLAVARPLVLVKFKPSAPFHKALNPPVAIAPVS